MKPSDKIEDVVKKMSFKVSPEMDQDLWAETLKARNEFHKMTLTPSQHNIWRIIMKSPITKVAVAAVVLLVCLIGLSLWRGTQSGIALADVLTRIEQVTGYMYQMNKTITKHGTITNSTSTVLVSQDHGVKRITRETDPNTGKIKLEEEYWLPRQNRRILVNHDNKEYLSITFEDVDSQNFEEEHSDPRTIIKEFLRSNHTSLGQSILDGVTVEGFQTTDGAYREGFRRQAQFLAPSGKVSVKIWVDVNTFLPMRTEEEITTKRGISAHYISYDFRWNVVVEASDFEPNIPEDYWSIAGDMPYPSSTSTEEDAIKGLKAFADLSGRYPVRLNPKTFLDQALKLLGNYRKLPHDEKTRINERILKPIIGLSTFYRALVKDKRDISYYGEKVTPKDTDKVLMRWKISDNEYRVIYGDLHAETITAEKLAELEKDIPK